MNAEIGRNAPCPCGSGRKYKKCCLRKQQDADRARAARSGAVARALVWMDEHYGDAVVSALEAGFFGGLADGEHERIAALRPDLHEMIEINSKEWLIADASLELDGGRVTTTALVLADGGPLITVDGRAYLEALRRQPLRLYEVVRSVPGESLELRDLREDGAPSLTVVERAGSRSLAKGDAIGARVIPGTPMELSGAVYDLSGFELEVHAALDELEATGEANAEKNGLAIIDAWLHRFLAPPPRLVDAGSGANLMLVTDHYRVLDRAGLEKALGGCPDVEQTGNDGWVRLEEPESPRSRPRVAINPGKRADLIEFFARTLDLADENRAWFQQVAGNSVAFVTREIVDPLARLESRQPPLDDAKTILRAGAERELHREIYRDWADEPIPALGGITPREAVKTKKGRQKVERLLRSYEAHEARAARQSGGEPLDFGFLWNAVGLERPVEH